MPLLSQATPLCMKLRPLRAFPPLKVADLSRRSGFIRQLLRRSVATFILQRNARDFAGYPLPNQPRNLERRLLASEPGAVDVGDAVAVGIGAGTFRGEGQVGAEAVGRGQT